MDLFFIIKKSIWRKPSLSFQRLGTFLKTNKHLKVDKRKSEMLKGIHLFLFIVFIYLNYFLVLFLCPSFSYKVSPQD